MNNSPSTPRYQFLGYLSSLAEVRTWLLDQNLESPWIGAIQEHPFPIRLPLHYARLIDWSDPQDPLALMVLPTAREHTVMSYELADPIGDDDHEVVPGLIHRYTNRALLLLTMYCRVHCRFCFRRDVVSQVRPVDLTAIRTYLSTHPEIAEIIFSGGDPLSFLPAFLDQVLADLPQREIRFHSRIPVVDPASISLEMIQYLTQLARSTIVRIILHINHPKELSPELRSLIAQLLQNGVLLQSQTVLLKGVNDFSGVLFELWNELLNLGVKPKYLHHLDRAKGTDQFRLSFADGMKIYSRETEHLPIHSLRYVIDLPAGHGKVDLASLTPINLAEGRFKVLDKEGCAVEVVDPTLTSNVAEPF